MHKKNKANKRPYAFKRPYETEDPNSITSMFVKPSENNCSSRDKDKCCSGSSSNSQKHYNSHSDKKTDTTIEDIEVIHEFFKLKYNIDNLNVIPISSNQKIKTTHDNIKNFEMITDLNDDLSTIHLTDDINKTKAIFLTGDFNSCSAFFSGILAGINNSTQI